MLGVGCRRRQPQVDVDFGRRQQRDQSCRKKNTAHGVRGTCHVRDIIRHKTSKGSVRRLLAATKGCPAAVDDSAALVDRDAVKHGRLVAHRAETVNLSPPATESYCRIQGGNEERPSCLSAVAAY